MTKISTLPAYYRAEQNDSRLCVKGTEHLYTVYAVYEDGCNLRLESRAENCTGIDAEAIADAFVKRDDGLRVWSMGRIR